MITLVHGEDDFLLAEEERRLVREIVDPAWLATNLDVLEGPTTSPSAVVTAAQTPSFFGERLVVVRDCPWFSPGKGRSEDAETPTAGDSTPLVELLERGLCPGTHLLLLVSRKVHKGMATTKAAGRGEASGKVRIVEFPAPDPRNPAQTVAWLRRHAEASGIACEPRVPETLVARLGQDKYMLAQELAKLGAYAGQRRVTAADIELLSPPGETDVFKLLEDIALRRPEEAIAHLRKLLVTDHPLKVVATLATLLRNHVQQKALLEAGRRGPEIAEILKMHPFRVQKELERVQRWTAASLLEASRLVGEAEAALKGSGLPEPLVMERMIARMAHLHRNPG